MIATESSLSTVPENTQIASLRVNVSPEDGCRNGSINIAYTLVHDAYSEYSYFFHIFKSINGRLRTVDDEIYRLQAQVCKSLSSPVRLKVLDLLRARERSVKDLVSRTGVSQPNLSIHLKFLWETGVLARRQEGTTVYYRVARREIFDVIDIFRKINTEKLARRHRLSRKRLTK